jgi:hypothetical protein
VDGRLAPETAADKGHFATTLPPQTESLADFFSDAVRGLRGGADKNRAVSEDTRLGGPCLHGDMVGLGEAKMSSSIMSLSENPFWISPFLICLWSQIFVPGSG